MTGTGARAKSDTTSSKKAARQSLTNATNGRVVLSEDEYNTDSSSDSDGDDAGSDNDHDNSDNVGRARAKAAGSSKRVRKVDTPDTSLEADVDTEPESESGPQAEAKTKTLFGRARALLRAPLDADTSLVGRDTERRELTAYLRGNTLKSLYVSGGPGTGKTALTREVLASFDKTQQKRVDEDGDELEEWARELPARKVYVNCVGRREEAVWDTILAALDEHDEEDVPRGRSPVKSKTKSPRKRTVTSSPTKARTGKRDGKKEFERWLAREGGRCILVLDEIDHLSASSGVLAGVFALPSQLNDESASDSALRVVAISNSHTLGTRSAHVSTLHFAPYERDQMAAIARGRLAPLSSMPEAKTLVPGPVVAFAAAKVAAVTGDVRALVALLVRTMDVAERRSAKTSSAVLSAGPPDVLEALKSVQLVAAARPSRPAPTTSASAPTIPTSATKSRSGPTAGLALQPKLALLCLMLAKRRLASGLSLGIMGVGTIQTATDPFTTPRKNKAMNPFKSVSPSKGSQARSDPSLDAGTLHAFYTHALGRSSAIVGVSRTEFADVLSVLEACGATCTSTTTSSSSSFSPFKGKGGLGRSASFSGAGAFGGAARALDVPECVRPEDLWVDGGVEGDLVRGLWEKEGKVIEREMPKPVVEKGQVEGMEVDE